MRLGCDGKIGWELRLIRVVRPLALAFPVLKIHFVHPFLKQKFCFIYQSEVRQTLKSLGNELSIFCRLAQGVLF